MRAQNPGTYPSSSPLLQRWNPTSCAPTALQPNRSPRNSTPTPRNLLSLRTIFQRPSFIIPLIQLNSSTRCNLPQHIPFPNSMNPRQCIISTPLTIMSTRPSRAISPMLPCSTGTTVILPTRPHPQSFIPRLSIIRSTCPNILTNLAHPYCSVRFLPRSQPQQPAIRTPWPGPQSHLVTKIKSPPIPRPPFTSERLASLHPLFLRRISLI